MREMKRLFIILVLFTLLIVTPSVSIQTDYSPDLIPRQGGNTIIEWTVVDAPDAAFALFWSGADSWIAEAGSQMEFNVTDASGEIEGQLTLGNVTFSANNTNIAKDLILGVWGLTPWFPGLVVKIGESSMEALNQTAFASAERVYGNYLNGSMVSSYEAVLSNGISYDCIIFEYEQDPTGFGDPQLTTLAYDTETGVLVKANTSFSFGTPYSLILELEGIYIPTVDPSFLWMGVAIVGVVIVIVALLRFRR
ncbi:MAG: hypothetical protein ACFFEA_04965 [Candidatus Thorarchaeota archaeon]